MLHWDMDPEIFRIGIFAIRWYSVLFMMSFIWGIFFFNWIYKKENKPLADLDHLLIYMLLGTVIGARLGHCLFYDPGYYLSHPLKILMVWEGGLASHGAAIGILLALYIYSGKRKDQPFLWLVDRMAVGVALAGFFIRTGNFFNSEIIGGPSKLPWAIIFDKVNAIPRHPAQLYEAFAYLIIFIILLLVYKRKMNKTPHGLLLGLFLIFIFGFRFFVEFVKEDQVSFEAGMTLNMGQLLSIPAVLAGVILLWRTRKK